MEAPKRATKFAANEQYTALYKKLFGMEKITQSLAIATGVSAGVTEAVIIVPFELVKIRMQDKANVSAVARQNKGCKTKMTCVRLPNTAVLVMHFAKS